MQIMRSFPRRSSLRSAVVFVAAAVSLVGCSAGSGTGSFGDGGSEGGVPRTLGDGGAAIAQDCMGIPASQTVSQPCCLASGIDACGASLFCAAFDGRKQPTCYLERSRLDMTECTEDRQCTSGECNLTARECRSVMGAACTEAVGCAATGGRSSVCVDAACAATDGKTGSPCATSADCTGGACSAEHRCVGKAGATCSDNGSKAHCAEGLCCKGGTCSDCRAGVGQSCTPFIVDCQPGLLCCPFAGSGAYCYATCS